MKKRRPGNTEVEAKRQAARKVTDGLMGKNFYGAFVLAKYRGGYNSLGDVRGEKYGNRADAKLRKF